MDRRDIADLLVFQAVAETGSFTRAAARMGRAQSGLSQTITALEGRLGVALLARSTRSVRPTDAGKRLLEQIVPALRLIESGLSDAKNDQNRPSGTLRLTAMEYPARTILVPALADFIGTHPGVRVEIDVSDRFVDIVDGGFDAGIRFGNHLEQDMVAIPIGPDMNAAIVASPAYYDRRSRPRALEDLAMHDCVNFRTASHGDIYRWVFKQRGRTIDFPVDGACIVNDAPVMIEAAVAGLGLAYVFEPHVSEHLAAGRLKTCLERFCPVWPAYHLYYPSRRQKSPALSALIERLRHQATR